MSSPPVTLVDRDAFDSSIPLFNVQQNRNSTNSQPDIDSIYSHASDQAFIVTLEQTGSLTINGRASGIRISNHSDYSNDPLTALAEYAAELIAHIDGQQGTGFRIENDHTGRDTNCILEEVTIIRRRAEKYEFDYSIEARKGRQSFMLVSVIDPDSVNPSSGADLGGLDLHEIEEIMWTVKQNLHVSTYAKRDASENEVVAQSGAELHITIRGSIPGDESTRKNFDTTIADHIGKNNATTFNSAFPGTSHEVVVLSHDAAREAGRTKIGQYEIDLVEGRVSSSDSTVVSLA